MQRNDVQLRQGARRHRLHPPQAKVYHYQAAGQLLLLSGPRSRQILQAHSQASKFRNPEFEVVCEAETTHIPELINKCLSLGV